jgi:hypothetical protein
LLGWPHDPSRAAVSTSTKPWFQLAQSPSTSDLTLSLQVTLIDARVQDLNVLHRCRLHRQARRHAPPFHHSTRKPLQRRQACSQYHVHTHSQPGYHELRSSLPSIFPFWGSNWWQVTALPLVTLSLSTIFLSDAAREEIQDRIGIAHQSIYWS